MSNCIIEFDEDGFAKVSTPEGKPSRLYAEALDLLQDQGKAIEVVSVAYTPTYKELHPNKTSEPSLAGALATFNYIRAKELQITTTDLMDVADIIFETGTTSIEALETELTKTFRPDGITDINEQRLKNSGLYTEKEVIDFVNNRFDLERLNRTIDVVSRLSGEEFETTDLELDNFYDIITAEKDGLGRHKKVSDTTIDSMIAKATKGYSTEESFAVKIQDLDLPSLVQKFNEDTAFAEKVYKRIDSFTAIDVIEIVNGELVNKPSNSSTSAVNSTIVLGKDSGSFRSLVTSLLAIDADILESEPQLLNDNLDQLEKLAINLNIDIIGLKNLAINEKLTLLNEASIIANKASQKRLTTDDIVAFTEIRDKLLSNETGFEQSLEILEPSLGELNTLKLYTELSEEKLMTEHGLIRVGENLYHRVDNEDSIDKLYDELYKRYLDDSSFVTKGFIKVDDKFAPSNKPIILEGLKSFVNTRKTGLAIESTPINERASIFQVLFSHKPLATETKDAFRAIASTVESSDYLTKQFVADFYALYLTEKQANSKLYNDVLSKFVFNNKDITIKGIDNRFLNTLNTVEVDIPAYEHIRAYAALKKNDPINALAVFSKPVGILPNVDRVQIANNPHLLPTYQGNVTKIKGYIYTKAKESFIKVDNNIYQRVGNNVYTKLISEKSTNYFTMPIVNYDIEEVNAIDDAHNTPKEKPFKTLQEFTETINNKTLASSTSELVGVLNANTDPKVKTAFRVTNGSSFLSFSQNGNKVELAMVETPKADRGKGQAKKLVSEFVAALDQTGTESILYADPRDSDTTAEQLIEFYAEFGYKPGEIFMEGAYEMVRKPRVVSFQEATPINNEVGTIFNNNPALAEVGTTKQYADYLNTVYPQSIHQDIVTVATQVNISKEGGVEKLMKQKKDSKGSYIRIIKGFEGYGQTGKSESKDNKAIINASKTETHKTANALDADVAVKVLEKHDIPLNSIKDLTILNESREYLKKVLKSPNKNVRESHTEAREILNGHKQRIFRSNPAITAENVNTLLNELQQGMVEAGTDMITSNFFKVYNKENILFLGTEEDIEGFKDYVETQEVSFQETAVETVTTPTEIFSALESKLVGNISDNIVTSRSVIEKRFKELKKIGRVKESVNLDSLNGFRDGGVVYIINRDTNTLIHEHGHIWYSWAKENRPDLIEKGNSLVRNSKYYNNVEKSSLYSEMDEDLKLEEALVQAIGDKGAQFVDSHKKEGFREWLSDLWSGIKNYLGISKLTAYELENISLDDFAQLVAVDIIKNRKVDWKTNPYTIQPLLDDMLANKKGKMVNVQTIKQIINQKDTKQIDKQIIEEVLELPKYKGENKIFFDEFEADLKDMLMPLEVVKSNTYSDYGLTNTGVDASSSETHIFNTELEHGIRGHFSADFPVTEYLGDIIVGVNYSVERVKTNSGESVFNLHKKHSDGESQILKERTREELFRYVGESPLLSKMEELPIGETMDFQMYKYGGLSNSPVRAARNVNEASEVLSKAHFAMRENKNVIDLEIRPLNNQFAVVKAGVQLTQENIEDNVYTVTSSRDKAEQFIKEIANKKAINRGMFGHTRVWYDVEDVYVAEIQSDSYQKAKATQMLLDSYKKDSSKMPKAQKEAYDKVQKAKEIINKGNEDTTIFRLDAMLSQSYKQKAKHEQRIKEKTVELSNPENTKYTKLEIEGGIAYATKKVERADLQIKNYSQLLTDKPIKPILIEDLSELFKLRENYIKIYTDLVKEHTKNAKPLEELYQENIKLDSQLAESRNVAEYEKLREQQDEVARSIVLNKIAMDMMTTHQDLNNADSYRKYSTQIAAEMAFDGHVILAKLLKAETAMEEKSRELDASPSSKSIRTYVVPYGNITEQFNPRGEKMFTLKYGTQDEFVRYNTLEKVMDHIERVDRPEQQPSLKEYTAYFNANKNLPKLEQKVVDLMPTKDKQFLAHRKNYTERLLREEIRRNADLGMDTLSIPTPMTLAKIEGYTNEDDGLMPYTVETADDHSHLEVGDTIDHDGYDHIVVSSGSSDISAVKKDDIYIIEDEEDYKFREAESRAEEDAYEFTRTLTKAKLEVGDTITEEQWDALDKPYSLDNEAKYILEETEEGNFILDNYEQRMHDYYEEDFDLEDHITMMGYEFVRGDDFYYWNEGAWEEHFQQPDEYDSEIDVDALPDEQKTVLKKYEKLIEFFKKERPDAEIFLDDKGNEWLRTDLERSDAVDPVVMFQEIAPIVAENQSELNVNKVKEVFTTLQNPIDVVSLPNETKIDECRG